MAFNALSKFWFFQSRLIFEAPFIRLLDSLDVIFISPRLVTSNDEFNDYRVLSYCINVVIHIFCDLYSKSFLQMIQMFWYESNIDMLHSISKRC